MLQILSGLNLMAIADRQGDPEALEARLGRPLDNTRAVTMRDGIAVIPVTGPIMRYATALDTPMYVTANGIELFQNDPTAQLFNKQDTPVHAREV